MRALCTFVVVLKRAVSSERTDIPPHHSTSTLLKPPSTFNVPMDPIDSTYQLPIPFSSRSTVASKAPDVWDAWLSRHIERLSHPDQLEKGQWCGYYDYDGARSFDPPMLAIHFTVDRSPNLGAGLVRKVRARGHDGIGQFTLEGGVSKQGYFELRKTYIGAHSFDWICLMTPFGIFGSWGALHGNRFHRSGRVWLWKHEWNSL
jgi:hypothetical protein